MFIGLEDGFGLISNGGMDDGGRSIECADAESQHTKKKSRKKWHMKNVRSTSRSNGSGGGGGGAILEAAAAVSIVHLVYLCV